MHLEIASLKLSVVVERDRLVFVPGLVAEVMMVCPVCSRKSQLKTTPKNLAAPGGVSTIVSMNRIEDLCNAIAFQLVGTKSRNCEDCGVLSAVVKASEIEAREAIAKAVTTGWLRLKLQAIAARTEGETVEPGVMATAMHLLAKFDEHSTATP